MYQHLHKFFYKNAIILRVCCSTNWATNAFY